MKKTSVEERSFVEQTMINEGWKYLGTTDYQIWGKENKRIHFCPVTKRITKQYEVAK